MSFQIGRDRRLLAKITAAHHLTGFANDHSGSVTVLDKVAFGAFGSLESVSHSLAPLHQGVYDKRSDQELAAPAGRKVEREAAEQHVFNYNGISRERSIKRYITLHQINVL